MFKARDIHKLMSCRPISIPFSSCSGCDRSNNSGKIWMRKKALFLWLHGCRCWDEWRGTTSDSMLENSKIEIYGMQWFMHCSKSFSQPVVSLVSVASRPRQRKQEAYKLKKKITAGRQWCMWRDMIDLASEHDLWKITDEIHFCHWRDGLLQEEPKSFQIFFSHVQEVPMVLDCTIEHKLKTRSLECDDRLCCGL